MVTPHSWPSGHKAGLACAAIGAVGFLVTVLIHWRSGSGFTDLPDLWTTVPIFAAAAVPAIACVIRREGAYWLPLAGMTLALCSVFLGWAIALLAIALVAVIVAFVLPEVL